MRWLFSSPAKVDHQKVVDAIKAAEATTSGEIRVVLARHRTRHPLLAAREHFQRLGMEGTAERNGVLIFVAPRSRNFAVVGDKAVHEKCGEEFWVDLAEALSTRFKTGDFTGGLVEAIAEAGRLLAAHFPGTAPAPGDIEEA